MSDRFRYLSRLITAVAIGCGMTAVEARTWTARTGTSTVEAELVDVREGNVILRREDNNRLIQVPLDKLSLGDVQYVREAMQAAGMVPAAGSSQAAASSRSASAAPSIPSE